SLHSTITPRAGGLGFAFAVPALTAVGITARSGSVDPLVMTLLIAVLGLALVGLADDRWNIPAALRLVAQLVAAFAVVRAGGASFLHGVEAAVAIGAIVAITNIYNFMDGIDGIAASQGVIAASAMAVVASALGRMDAAIAMTLLAAGAAG